MLIMMCAGAALPPFLPPARAGAQHACESGESCRAHRANSWAGGRAGGRTEHLRWRWPGPFSTARGHEGGTTGPGRCPGHRRKVALQRDRATRLRSRPGGAAAVGK